MVSLISDAVSVVLASESAELAGIVDSVTVVAAIVTTAESFVEESEPHPVTLKEMIAQSAAMARNRLDCMVKRSFRCLV